MGEGRQHFRFAFRQFDVFPAGGPADLKALDRDALTVALVDTLESDGLSAAGDHSDDDKPTLLQAGTGRQRVRRHRASMRLWRSDAMALGQQRVELPTRFR